VVVHDITGVIVDRGKPDVLAAGVERLIRDADLRRAMGTAARDRVTREFNLTVQARHLRRFLSHGEVPAPEACSQC
jgi:glycosyltransferase involved in cell wall biosynthesis